MELWWKDTDRGKAKYSQKKNPSQCQLIRHKFHVEWPEVTTVAQKWKPATKRLNHGNTLVNGFNVN
jgi:hypothetical protein